MENIKLSLVFLDQEQAFCLLTFESLDLKNTNVLNHNQAKKYLIKMRFFEPFFNF